MILRLVAADEVMLADGRVAWTTKAANGSPALTLVGWKMGPSEWMRAAPEGLLLEFGVATGKSFNELCRNAHPRVVYGFDWWGGLPHDWNPYDVRGALKCEKPVPPPNGVLIEGLFSDTLEEFLGVYSGPVAFAHIDCDLYCASAYVLHCLMDRFVAGSIVAFDEIEQWDGERQAWNRYLAKSGQRWELIGKQHAWGEVYRRENNVLRS